jgi:hypothetical protein
MSRKFKKNDLMISSIFLNDYYIDNIYVSGVPMPVESRTGAVANLLRFLSLLIKPDVRSYRIRLSD